jgi:hypothetical protein
MHWLTSNTCTPTHAHNQRAFLHRVTTTTAVPLTNTGKVKVPVLLILRVIHVLGDAAEVAQTLDVVGVLLVDLFV